MTPSIPAFAELSCSLQLRFADLNAAGHVANTAVPVLFDEARVRTLGVPQSGSGAGLLAALGPSYATLVGQVSVEYVREMVFEGQDVEVRSWVSGLGGSRFALSSVLLDGGEVAATSDCVVIIVSADDGRPVPLPETLRARLVELSGPAVPLRPRLTDLP